MQFVVKWLKHDKTTSTALKLTHYSVFQVFGMWLINEKQLININKRVIVKPDGTFQSTIVR